MVSKLILSALFLAAPLAYATPTPMPADPTPAASVDLKQYLGTWYSIASIPEKGAQDCAADMKAVYTADMNGLIKVMNSCKKKDGTTLSLEGRARPQDPTTSSRLQVTFIQQNQVWNFDNAAPYWILDVAPDYSWALVGGPKFETGWILSRMPSLPDMTLKDLKMRLKKQGYDTCKFMIDPQTGGRLDRKPLCKNPPAP